jgi:L-ascorbate metabolism protein UlaG (beta-lactamase superfamily)
MLTKSIYTFFLFLIINSAPVNAKISFQYSGIAGIHLTDGITSLFFDPVFSRPNVFETLTGSEYKINSSMIHSELKKLSIQNLDAIFIGHTHQDHALDMHVIQKRVGGIIYGSRSTVNIALSLDIPKDKTQLFTDNSDYIVGDFTIKVLKSSHGKIFGIYKFRDGEILKPLKRKISLSDYVMGGSYSFYVTHPEGIFLIHQSSRSTSNVTELIKGKNIDIIFQGIANRTSSKALYDQIINIPNKVGSVVPIHHDNFFLDMNEKKMKYLWFVNLQDFIDESKKQKQNIILPNYRQIYSL